MPKSVKLINKLKPNCIIELKKFPKEKIPLTSQNELIWIYSFKLFPLHTILSFMY